VVIYKQLNPGDKYRPIVTVLKIKKGVPTVIRVSGREYVLRAEGQFNQRKKGAVHRGRAQSDH
jgi:hypothetical protein